MCNCNFVPMMMCCNCGGNNNAGGGGSTGFKEIVLYDGIMNAVGSYTLTDNINNYDDICIIHSTKTGESTQYMTIPVSCIKEDILVCHGDGSGNLYLSFKINGTVLNLFDGMGSYQIVKIIGRKY